MNSREKGKRGERQARDAVRVHWHAMEAIRAAQENGSYSADLLYALPNSHIEVKSVAKIGALRFLKQAEHDADKTELPVVLMREDGDTEFVVMFRLKNSKLFAERLQRGIEFSNARQADQGLQLQDGVAVQGDPRLPQLG